MPSIVAQSRPAAFALALRFEANLGDSRSAGGVGSGSGEFSQIVAALAGPSTSGAGAGFCFGSRMLRSFVFFQPLAAFADTLADGLAAFVPAEAAVASAVEAELGFGGGVGSAASWSTLSSVETAASAAAVASELGSAGTAPASAGAGAATAEASSTAAEVASASVVVVAVVSTAIRWESPPLRGPS
jgi:hypothetical protein